MLEQDLMQIDFFPLAQVVESLDIYMWHRLPLVGFANEHIYSYRPFDSDRFIHLGDELLKENY
jgi:hypothetical protein